MDVLEVGCGTGRFATFVRDNHPTACVTMLDLSPFYLEEARKNHENWCGSYCCDCTATAGRSPPVPLSSATDRTPATPRHPSTIHSSTPRHACHPSIHSYPPYHRPCRERTRGAEERNQGTRVGTARFVQGKAESLPFPHASLDIVTSTYMLHEIPLHARVPFFKEASRVLRPNGRLIVNDSIQLGDRPDRDARIGRFGESCAWHDVMWCDAGCTCGRRCTMCLVAMLCRLHLQPVILSTPMSSTGDFNEPWYRDYVRTDLGQLGLDAGLTPETKMLGSASKCLSFRKPGGEL